MRTGMTISITNRVRVLVHDEGLDFRRTRYEQDFVPREPAFAGEVVPEDEGAWGEWTSARYDLRPEFDTGVPVTTTLAPGALLDALAAIVGAAEAFEVWAPR